jgi:hypothetical protein
VWIKHSVILGLRRRELPQLCLLVVYSPVDPSSVKRAMPAGRDITDRLFASCSLGAFDAVPPDVVETILGSLDLRTLCTTRLVCKLFRASASQFLHSLKLFPKDVRFHRKPNFSNFPKLSGVSLLDVAEVDFPLLAQPAVRDAVTHVRLVLGRVHPSQETVGAPMPPLPNLVSLTVLNSDMGKCVPFPLTLKELYLDERTSYPHADVSALTGLTRLHVNLFDDMRTLFDGLTAMTTLRHLEISGPKLLIPVLEKLTQLTHLRFRIREGGQNVLLTRLTCLGKLLHLEIKSDDESMGLEQSNEVDRIVRGITSLKSLSLGLRHGRGSSLLSTGSVSALSHLTALRLNGGPESASSLSGFYLEGLRCLTFSAFGLERDLGGTLGRATALTKLSVSCGQLGAVSVSRAISSMPQLREMSLCISTTAGYDPRTFQAIGLLTSLTSLSWNGGEVTNADMEACVGLRKLRLLKIMAGQALYPSVRVSPETFLAVARLPELARFDMRVTLGSDRGRIRTLLDFERRSKGWPPLDLYLFGFSSTL